MPSSLPTTALAASSGRVDEADDTRQRMEQRWVDRERAVQDGSLLWREAYLPTRLAADSSSAPATAAARPFQAYESAGLDEWGGVPSFAYQFRWTRSWWGALQNLLCDTHRCAVYSTFRVHATGPLFYWHDVWHVELAAHHLVAASVPGNASSLAVASFAVDADISDAHGDNDDRLRQAATASRTWARGIDISAAVAEYRWSEQNARDAEIETHQDSLFPFAWT